MLSPKRDAKLLQEEKLSTPHFGEEDNRDGIPEEIWQDIKQHERFIYYSLMFLNGSVLWAYYSCLSGQNFYAARFPNVSFVFLTTLVTAWPMVIGHLIQMVFGIDKKISQSKRVIAGFVIFIAMAVLIMVFSGFEFADEKLGGGLVLACFGIIGFANSLSEATFYTMAALFPVEKFTNAVQIGNVWAGVLNITVATLIRLIVGGVKQTADSTELSFYLFFCVLIIVCCTAIYLYKKLISLRCIQFLLERNEEATLRNNLHTQGLLATLSNLCRIFTVIWVPAVAQFLIFFVSLAVFPGFGCTAGRIYGAYYQEKSAPDAANWFCAPGIIGSYNFGDFFGRIICTAAVYKIFTMRLSMTCTILRLGFIPILLMGVYGSSIYVFGDSITGALLFEIFVNFAIGLSNGLLATVTMGVAPRMVTPDDRESAGAIMVLFLFLGIAGGATFGFLVSEHHLLGL